MLFRNKLVNLLVVFTFLANTIVYDNSSAQPIYTVTDHLSPVLKCNDLLGLEHKDYFRIQFALKPHLQEINSILATKEDFDIDYFKEKLGYKFTKENTVFFPSEVQLFYSEAEQINNEEVVVMCRVVDPPNKKTSKTERTRTYYLVISTNGSGNNKMGFKEIYTEEEYQEAKGDISLLGSRSAKDKSIIARYSLQNEEIIDTFIRERIDSGDFAEIGAQRLILEWQKKFPEAKLPAKENIWPADIFELFKYLHLNDFFHEFNTFRHDIFSGKNLVFIKVPEGQDKPVVEIHVDEEGNEVPVQNARKTVTLEVNGHSSQNAVYVFLNEDMFKKIPLLIQKFKNMKELSFEEEIELEQELIRVLVHEAGVVHGLAHKYRGGKVTNDLDRVWEQFMAANYKWENFQAIEISHLLEFFPELKKIKEEPVDLDENLGSRDHMMAKKRYARVKKTPEQRLNKQIFDALKNIFRINPKDKASRAKGIRAVHDLISKIKNKTGYDTSAVVRAEMESEWFQIELDNPGFRSSLNSDRAGNFINNLSNAFDDHLNAAEENTAFDEFSQSVFYILYRIDQVFKLESESREPGEEIGSDFQGLYRVLFAMVYGGYDLGRVTYIYEDLVRTASGFLGRLKETDLDKFRKEIREASGKEIKEIIGDINDPRYNDMGIQEFLSYLKEETANKIKAEDMSLKDEDKGQLAQINKVRREVEENILQVYESISKAVEDGDKNLVFKKINLLLEDLGADQRQAEDIDAIVKRAYFDVLGSYLKNRKQKLLRMQIHVLDSETGFVTGANKICPKMTAEQKEKICDHISGEVIDKIIILAAESDPELLKQKILAASMDEWGLRNYLQDMDLESSDIHSSYELVKHLKERSKTLKFNGAYLDEIMLKLASSNIGDITFIETLMNIKNLPVDEYTEEMKKLEKFIGDPVVVEHVAEITAFMTQKLNVILYMNAYVLEMLKKDIPEDSLPLSKDQILFSAADNIYGKGRGETSLMEVLGGEKGKQDLYAKISAFISLHVKLLNKRGECDTAEIILKNYLKILDGLKDKEKYAIEKSIFLDLLNETYVNRIAFKTVMVQNLPKNTPLFDKSIQEKLSDILVTHKKRVQLWRSRDEAVPLAPIGMSQVLHALLYILPEDEASGGTNYADIVRFFESIDAWEWAEDIEKNTDGKVSLNTFFNYYINAVALDPVSFSKVAASGQSIVDYCIDTIFGEERAGEALTKLFPDENSLITREKDFMRLVDSMKFQYYQAGDLSGMVNTLRKFSSYIQYQLKTTTDEKFLEKVFSEDYLLDLYVTARLVDIEHLDELFKSDKNFIEYFASQLYGEAESKKRIRKFLGKKDERMRIEKNFLVILQIIQAQYYEANDFTGVNKLFSVYYRYMTHQARTLRGEYELKDLMISDDLIIYYYYLLLDEESMEEFAGGDDDFMEYAGKKLFGEDKAETIIKDIVSGDKRSEEDLQDPDLVFINMYTEHIRKAIQAGERDIVFETIELFEKYLENQKKYVSDYKKQYFQEIMSDIDRAKPKLLVMQTFSLEDKNGFADVALDYWTEISQGYREMILAQNQKQKEAEQEAEKKKKEEEIRVRKEKEEKRRKEQLAKREEYRDNIRKIISEIDRQINLAKENIADKKVITAGLIMGAAEEEYEKAQDYLKKIKKSISSMDEDIRKTVKVDLKEFNDEIYVIKKKIRDVNEALEGTKKEFNEIFDEIEKENYARISAYEQLLTEEISELTVQEKNIENILEEAAKAFDLLNAHRLVDARESMSKIMGFYGRATKYVEALKKRKNDLERSFLGIYRQNLISIMFLDIESEVPGHIRKQEEIVQRLYILWQAKYTDTINEMKRLLSENGDTSIFLVKNALETEEKEELEDLTRKWEQVTDGVDQIKKTIEEIYSLIKAKKIQAAGSLYAALVNKIMPYNLRPMEAYLSLLNMGIDSKGRRDFEPEKEKTLEYKKNEVEKCVSKLGETLKKEQEIFYKELEELRKVEKQMVDKAKACLKAVNDPAGDAMGHAKGVMLDLAEAVMTKSEENLKTVNEQIDKLKEIADLAEGDWKDELELKIKKLNDDRDQTEKVLVELETQISEEKQKILDDEKIKREIENKLEEVIISLGNAHQLINEWQMDEVQSILTFSEGVISDAEEYLAHIGGTVPLILNPRKRKLLANVLDIRSKKTVADEKLKEIKPLFEKESLKGKRDLEKSKEALETHNVILTEVRNARESFKKGDIEGALDILSKAEEDTREIDSYMKNLSIKFAENNDAGRKKWIEKEIDRFKILFDHENEKIRELKIKIDSEKDLIKDDDEAYVFQETLLVKAISDSSEIIGRLNQGNIRGADKWIERASSVKDGAEKYLEAIKDITAEDNTISRSRKNRLKDNADNIKILMSNMSGISNTVERLVNNAATIEKTDEDKRQEVDESLADLEENISGAESLLAEGDAGAAEYFLSGIEAEISFIENYLKNLNYEEASPKRKLLIARNRLQVDRALEALKRRVPKVREVYETTKLEPFLDNIREFSRFSFDQCPKKDVDPLQISNEELSSIDEKIDYIDFLRKNAQRKEFKGDKEVFFDSKLNSLIMLLDLGDMKEEYIDRLRDMLEDELCTENKRAMIHAALLRSNIEPVKNLSILRSMLSDERISLKTEIIVRGLLLEMGEYPEDQIKFFDRIMELDDRSYSEAGLDYMDDAWITTILLLNGIEVEDNIEWLKDAMQVLRDERNEKRVDSALETLIYYAFTKYALLKKFSSEQKKNIVKREIALAGKKAHQAGLEIPTNVNTRYTLIVPSDFFNNGELHKYENMYQERFNIKTIGSKSKEKFVNRVFSFISLHNNNPDNIYKIKNSQVVVLVPSNISEEYLKRLIDEDIRFVRISSESIDQAKQSEEIERERFQKNTFAIMILSRLLDAGKISESYMLRLMDVYKFYLRTHFDLDGITAEEFVKAVTTGDLAVLVKGLLLFKPMEKYAMPEYDKVQEALIFA